MAIDVLALANQAAATDDQSKETKGFEAKIPTPGLRGCRFVEYIELGKHQKPAGKFGKKPPVDMVRLTFELLGKNDIEDITINDTTKRVGKKISLRLTKSLSAKSDFKKIMNLMDRGRGKTHMAQMLGEAFLVKVTNVTEDGELCTPENKKEAKYANLYSGPADAKNWTFAAPLIEDPETGEVKQVRVLQQTCDLKIFLWNNPTIETWDSLFIDGTREVKAADGTVKMESKNFIQEMCMSAADFEGSALQAMLVQMAATSDSHAAANAALLGDDPLAEVGDLDAPF